MEVFVPRITQEASAAFAAREKKLLAEAETPIEAPVKFERKKKRKFVNFPINKWSCAGIIAYQATVVPNKWGKDDIKPHIRFMFSNGKFRKWSKWMSQSFHYNSYFMRMFAQCHNRSELLSDCNLLFNIPFEILLEENKANDKYINIAKARLAKDFSIGDIFYDEQYAPAKTAKVYKIPCRVMLTILKTKTGLLRVSNEDSPAGEKEA
jgi:hypothetical protein